MRTVKSAISAAICLEQAMLRIKISDSVRKVNVLSDNCWSVSVLLALSHKPYS